MERDAGISHGASAFIRERLMHVSDAYQTVFCTSCGTFAINDAATRRYKSCRLCGNDRFGRATIPYVYKLLIHLLGAAGMFLHPEFMTMEEYAEMLFNGKEVDEEGDLVDIQIQLHEADEAFEEEQEEFEDEGLDTDYAEIYE